MNVGVGVGDRGSLRNRNGIVMTTLSFARGLPTIALDDDGCASMCVRMLWRRCHYGMVRSDMTSIDYDANDVVVVIAEMLTTATLQSEFLVGKHIVIADVCCGS